MSQRWVIYCRVSTEDQENHGTSLAYQKSTSEKFVLENGLHVPEELIFLEQYSGGYFDRPILSEILSLAKRGKIDFIVFTKRDRVARDQFVYQKIMNELGNARVRVYFSEEKLTGDESMDNFMGSTIVGFAQWEREQIKRRTYSWKIQHARQNKWPFANVPYGYSKNPNTKELEIFEDEANIVKLIYNLYTERSFTIDAISQHLTKEWVLPPSLSTKWTGTQKGSLKMRKNSSSKWIPSTVFRILSRTELYMGSHRAFSKSYKKIGTKTVVIGDRPKDEWIYIAVPVLILKEQSENVLEKMEYNRRFNKKRSHRQYLLRGKLLCDCEPELHAMIGYAVPKKVNGVDGMKEVRHYTNYRCTMCNHGKSDELRRCGNYISGAKVEAVVLDTIKEFLTDPESIFGYENRANVESDRAQNEAEERFEKLMKKLEAIATKLKRTEELFIDGLISKDRMKELKGGLDEEKEWLQTAVDRESKLKLSNSELEAAQEAWSLVRIELESVVDEFFMNASFEDLKTVLDMLVDRVVISSTKKKVVSIRLRIPFHIGIADAYYEDEKITWSDDSGKEHVVMEVDNLVPAILPLWESYDPIIGREVIFSESDDSWEDDEDENDKGWKWGGGGGDPGVIDKVLHFLEKQYHQHCKSLQTSIKIPTS